MLRKFFRIRGEEGQGTGAGGKWPPEAAGAGASVRIPNRFEVSPLPVDHVTAQAEEVPVVNAKEAWPWSTARMMTRSGGWVGWFTDPPPLADVLISLGRLPRFAGHTTEFWTVLQHSLLVYDLSRGLEGSVRLAALLHDAGECLIGDIPTPFKHPDYHALERQFVERLCHREKIRPYSWYKAWQDIEALDKRAKEIEGAQLTRGPWPPTSSRDAEVFKRVRGLHHHPDGRLSDTHGGAWRILTRGGQGEFPEF